MIQEGEKNYQGEDRETGKIISRPNKCFKRKTLQPFSHRKVDNKGSCQRREYDHNKIFSPCEQQNMHQIGTKDLSDAGFLHALGKADVHQAKKSETGNNTC